MPDQPRCIYELPSPVHLCSTFPTASVHLWSTPCAVHTPMRLSQCIYVVTYPTASVHLWSTHCAVSTCIYVVTFYNTTMHYLPKCIEAVTTTLCIYPNESSAVHLCSTFLSASVHCCTPVSMHLNTKMNQSSTFPTAFMQCSTYTNASMELQYLP